MQKLDSHLLSRRTLNSFGQVDGIGNVSLLTATP